MNLLYFFTTINAFLDLPTTFLFLFVGIFLTIQTKFIQIRALPRFYALLTQGLANKPKDKQLKTMNPFHALFTAMSTTIGIGNIVGPSFAITIGGPGALFWLVFYAFFGCVTKYAEVVFALTTREKTEDGHVVGGPMRYLRLIHPFLGWWYGAVTIVLFAGWSGIQTNTLALILVQENVSKWIVGLVLSSIMLFVLFGGIKRIGELSSRLVPLMFVLYLVFAFFILFKDLTALANAFKLIFTNIFRPAAAVGGFIGATIFDAIRSGVYRCIFITEAGLGTSSIPHSLADVKNPTDQGILALFSVAADTLLSVISGLLVLVTGIWQVQACGTGILVYDIFKTHSPFIGQLILLLSITLFAFTTIIGNSFNGSLSFAYFTKFRYLGWYYLFAAVMTFMGALVSMPLIWSIMDTFMTLVAIPNLIGIIILAIKYSDLLKIKDSQD